MLCLRSFFVIALVWCSALPGIGMAGDRGLLDGLAVSGMIGPAPDPDLADTLYFDEGHFWSEICTACGFVPGRYEAQATEQGIAFSGTLESDSRGQFDYVGLLAEDGTLIVEIRWQKRRWYWTVERELIFEGTVNSETPGMTVSDVLDRLKRLDPDANPACARF